MVRFRGMDLLRIFLGLIFVVGFLYVCRPRSGITVTVPYVVLFLGGALFVFYLLVGREIIHGLQKCPSCEKRFSLEEVKEEEGASRVKVWFKCRHCGADRGQRKMLKTGDGD